MRTKIKTRIWTILFTLFLCVTASFPAFAAGEMPRLVDEANLLTDSGESELLAMLDEISERQKVDVVVAIVNTLDGKSPRTYADDFFDYNGYGFGADADGILLLVGMEDRDVYISAHGYESVAITDAGCDSILDAVVSELGDGAYLDACKTYAGMCDTFISQAKNGNPYGVGNMPKEPFSIGKNLAISFGVGIVLALIITGIMAAQLKSVRKQVTADKYVKTGSMQVTERRDLFLYKHTERHEKPKENSSSDRSSSHRSSSGRTHTGGGRKF